MAKIKLTYNKGLSIQNTIISQRGQQTVKSELAKAKGDTGVKVYHLRHDIREAFKPLDEQRSEIIKDYQVLSKEKTELIGDSKAENLKGDSKKRLEEIEKEQAELQKELNNIGEEEKEFSLTKGKLNLSEIKDFVDGIELEVLEPVIDFKK